ncbi:hypothetical protein [Streptomyces sp. NPDC051219]|uniref:hypothetical protein n=1 Tax=Streptomyces sp. NPDC051219 TaxID=3155283 RepID=UPI00343DC98A
MSNVLDSGITLGGLTVITLNLFFNVFTRSSTMEIDWDDVEEGGSTDPYVGAAAR